MCIIYIQMYSRRVRFELILFLYYLYFYFIYLSVYLSKTNALLDFHKRLNWLCCHKPRRGIRMLLVPFVTSQRLGFFFTYEFDIVICYFYLSVSAWREWWTAGMRNAHGQIRTTPPIWICATQSDTQKAPQVMSGWGPRSAADLWPCLRPDRNV